MAHHIFCNKFGAPEEGCKMCEGLRERYPDNINPDEMMAKYFPSAIPVTPLNKACARPPLAYGMRARLGHLLIRWGESLIQNGGG